MSDTTTEEYVADAYIKLHEDVKTLILETVIHDIQANPYGQLATLLMQMVSRNARQIMDQEVQNYRIVYRGNTANF